MQKFQLHTSYKKSTSFLSQETIDNQLKQLTTNRNNW